jgi:hypothetical protein
MSAHDFGIGEEQGTLTYNVQQTYGVDCRGGGILNIQKAPAIDSRGKSTSFQLVVLHF